jgi:D-proline reductase (dithiol) PrdB
MTQSTSQSETTPGPSFGDEFDSLRYVDKLTKQVIKTWISREPAVEIPWTPLRRPLQRAKVALVTSAGIALRDQEAFDQQGERDNPWWGDPGYRVIPATTDTDQIRCYHLHINTDHPESDLDCALPLRRLRELADSGEIGEPAASHYSFMGYLTDAREFLQTSVPAIIETLRAEEVDVAIFVPV